jgi:membrane-associated phospholipid phosphatase
MNLRAPYRYVALVMPAFTLFGVVFTGNHFFLDAIAGAAVAAVAFWLALQLRRRLPDYKPFSVLA